MTVLCSSVSNFRIFDDNVICGGRGMADNVLGYFMLYILTKVYLAG